MKTLLDKLKNNFKEKGFKKTASLVFGFLKNGLTSEQHRIKLLGKYVREHNQAYGKISQLAMELNNGIHPKHEIIKYHEFFLNNIEPSDKVLDAGSGTGLVAYRLAEKAEYVLGVDFNEKSIKEAQTKYRKPNLKFLVADLNKYRPEEKFDKIVLSNVLEHIRDRVKLLNALQDIAPVVLLRVPLITRDWLTVYKKSKGFEYKLDPTHEIEYTPEELEKELQEAGWRIKSGQTNWGEWWGVIEHQ